MALDDLAQLVDRDHEQVVLPVIGQRRPTRLGEDVIDRTFLPARARPVVNPKPLIAGHRVGDGEQDARQLVGADEQSATGWLVAIGVVPHCRKPAPIAVITSKVCCGISAKMARNPGRWTATLSANSAESSMVAVRVMRRPPKASSNEAIGIELSAALDWARIKASTR